MTEQSNIVEGQHPVRTIYMQLSAVRPDGQGTSFAEAYVHLGRVPMPEITVKAAIRTYGEDGGVDETAPVYFVQAETPTGERPIITPELDALGARVVLGMLEVFATAQDDVSRGILRESAIPLAQQLVAALEKLEAKP